MRVTATPPRLLALALGLGLVVARPGAGAAGPATTGDEHRAEGYAHAERGEWDQAIRAYELAYAIDHDPVSLYAIGRIHAQRGDCARAHQAFERFLATSPPPRARASAEDEIARCQPAAAADPVASDDTDPADVDVDVDVDAPRPRAFYRDPIGGALFGTGVVAGAVGGYLYLRARDALCADPCTGSYESYEDSLAHARSLRTGALVAGGVGGALVVASIVRWVMVSGDDGAAEVDVAWTPRPGGGALVVGGRF